MRHLRALAELLKMSMAEVYEVATFYAHFDVIRKMKKNLRRLQFVFAIAFHASLLVVTS